MHKAYRGSSRRLVIAFDVGTTFSGISFSILEPGRVPEIKEVTKFPGQEEFQGPSKVPSVIYYDKHGNVAAVGAEAEAPEAQILAAENDWVKIDWFKLHLKFSPSSGFVDSSGDARDLPPLPLQKTAGSVLADFYRYLLRCINTYICDSHPFGDALWQSLAPTADFVLSHPNGWGGKQQAIMRQAAVDAKLIPDTSDGQARISMVTEGEASLHFALDYGLPEEALDPGNGVVIVDAGGGTIDISAYGRIARKQYAFEEIAIPQCHLQGATFVTAALRALVRSLLRGSTYLQLVDDIANFFDKSTKLRFSKSKADAPQYINFGTKRDHEPSYNIRFGQLKIEGKDTAKCFQKSIDCIVETVKAQRRDSTRPFDNVVLVGGMSANDFLFTQVKEKLGKKGFVVFRPDYHVNKAASHGAISHYLNHYVQARVTKLTYGMKLGIVYDPNNPEHSSRRHLAYLSADGIRRISVFSVIIPKGTSVDERETYEDHTSKYVWPESFAWSTMGVFTYNGSVTERFLWFDINPEFFEAICTIRANLKHLLNTPTMQYHRRPDGYVYGHFDAKITMQFGHVELKVFMSWIESGTEKSSDAQIVYFE